MRNRNYINRQIEQLENVLMNLRRLSSIRADHREYDNVHEQATELLGNLRTAIEQEPQSPEEINEHLRR